MILFRIIELLMCTNKKKKQTTHQTNSIWHYRDYLTPTPNFPSTKSGTRWKTCNTNCHIHVPDQTDSNTCQKGSISHCKIFLKTIHTPAHALTSTVTSYILLSAGQYICLLNSPSIWEVNLFSHFWVYWSYFVFGLHAGRIRCACSLISAGKGSRRYFSFK